MRAFTEIFTRVVLFPPRYIENITNPKKRKDVTKRSTRLNLAAIKSLMRLRREGKIILVFPAGTRYREGAHHVSAGRSPKVELKDIAFRSISEIPKPLNAGLEASQQQMNISDGNS